MHMCMHMHMHMCMCMCMSRDMRMYESSRAGPKDAHAGIYSVV